MANENDVPKPGRLAAYQVPIEGGAPIPGSFEAYQAELRQALEAENFFSFIAFIDQRNIVDGHLMTRLHTSYIEMGRQLIEANMTPEDIARQKQLAKEEAEELWGPED